MPLEGIFAELFERDIRKAFSGKSSSQLSTAKKRNRYAKSAQPKTLQSVSCRKLNQKLKLLRGVLSGSLVCPPGVLLGCPWGMTFACFPVCFRLCFPVYCARAVLKTLCKVPFKIPSALLPPPPRSSSRGGKRNSVFSIKLSIDVTKYVCGCFVHESIIKISFDFPFARMKNEPLVSYHGKAICFNYQKGKTWFRVFMLRKNQGLM